MNKKYEITWRPTGKEVLQITYNDSISLSEILNAHLEADDFVRSVPHNVVVFNDSQNYRIEEIRIGTIKEFIFNKIPRVPNNLKGIVIFVKFQFAALSIAIENLANVQYGRNFIQVVDSYEKAERIINSKLGK